MVLKIFKLLDCYGTSIQFTAFRKDVHKTPIGGLFSILSILCIICSTAYFGKDFYSRTNPYFTRHNFILQNYPFMNLNNSNFIIGFGIVDAKFDPVNYTEYFDIDISFNKFWISLSKKFSERNTIESSDCSNFKDFDISKNNNLTFPERMSCLNFNNMELGGFWDTNKLSLFNIDISKCSNRPKCKNDTEITNFLSNPIIFTIYTTQIYTDLNEKNQILKVNLKLFDIEIDFKVHKIKNIFYKNAKITTDMGILTSMSTNYSLLGIDYDKDDFKIIDNNSSDRTLFEANFYLGVGTEIYDVKYLKIQQVFANLGGIIGFINLIFCNVALVFNTHDKNIKLINKLFDFNSLRCENYLSKFLDAQIINKDKQDFSIQSNRIIFANSFSQSKVLQEIDEKSYKKVDQNMVLNDDFKKLLNNQMKKYKLYPSFICKCTKDKKEDFLSQLFSKAREIVKKKIDITYYLKFIEEFIFIKELLFDDISNLCLTLRKRPKIYERNNFVTVNLSKSERLKKVINYFVMNQNRITNNQFYEILDDNIKKIIKDFLYKN